MAARLAHWRTNNAWKGLAEELRTGQRKLPDPASLQLDAATSAAIGAVLDVCCGVVPPILTRTEPWNALDIAVEALRAVQDGEHSGACQLNGREGCDDGCPTLAAKKALRKLDGKEA